MTRHSKHTWSILWVIAIAGCGRSLVLLDDEGDASEAGGHSGSSGAGATGATGAAPTGGTTTAKGGSSSGLGGVGGMARGGTSNAGAGDGGQGPEDCDLDGDGVLSVRCGGDDCADGDPTIPDPNDSNAAIGALASQTIAELRGGAGLAVGRDGSVHVAVAMQGQVRYLVDGEPKHVLLADVQPSSEVRLALDFQGEPRILFGGLGSPVVFAVQSEGSWQVRQLDSDGWPVSLFVGQHDDKTILGYIEDPLGGQRLHLGIGRGIDLDFRALTGPTSAALALGPSGELHIVSQNAGTDLVYSILDLVTDSLRAETLPRELTALPIGLSFAALTVNRAGAPGLGVIVDDVLVYLVRDPMWRRVEIPSPLYPEPPLVVSDEAGAAHLLLSGGGGRLTYLSEKSDGWTETEYWSIGPPRAFVLDPLGVVHAVVESSEGTSVGSRDHVTNRDIVPDAVDRNCDGVDGIDRDRDGHASSLTGGDDCDDDDFEINPDIEDVHGDGVDSDCNGFGHCPKGLPGPAFVEVPYGNRGFCMDATEVTNADYAAFLASGVAPSSYSRFNDTFEPAPLGAPAAFDRTCPGFLPETMIPVTCVDWWDAWAYCAWAGKRLCGASFGRPISDPSESVWRIACDSGLMGIGDFGAVWEWQDGCTLGSGSTPDSDSCPAYGGRFTTAPPPERCNESISLARGDVSDIVGFRCCDL